MRGLLKPVIFTLTLLVAASGAFIIMNKTPGVAVSCEGNINGFGVPGIPLGTFESQCRAKVEVFQGNKSICTGEAPVQGSASVIPCEGLSGHEGEVLYVETDFFNESERYAEDSGDFRY